MKYGGVATRSRDAPSLGPAGLGASTYELPQVVLFSSAPASMPSKLYWQVENRFYYAYF